MPVAIGLAPMYLKSSRRTGNTVPFSLRSFVQLAQTNYGRTAYLETDKLFFNLHADTIKQNSTKTVYVKPVYSCREIATFDKLTHLDDI